MPISEFTCGELDSFFVFGDELLKSGLSPTCFVPSSSSIEKINIQKYGLSKGLIQARITLNQVGLAGMGAIFGVRKLVDEAFPDGSPYEHITIGVKARWDGLVVGVGFCSSKNPAAPLIESLVDRHANTTGADYIKTPDWSLGDPMQDEALRELATPKFLISAGSYVISIAQSIGSAEEYGD